MLTLLKPWTALAFAPGNECIDHVESLARFISQTARSLAYISQFDAKKFHSYGLTGRSAHLSLLCSALRRLAFLPWQARDFLTPNKDTASRRACYASPSPFLPTTRHEILREWKFVQFDVDSTWGLCSYCRRDCDDDQDHRLCIVCSAITCNECFLIIETSPPHVKSLGHLRELLKLEGDMLSILDSLEDIAHRSSEVLRSVLSQDEILKWWVCSKVQSYRDWEHSQHDINLQTYYSHFRKANFAGWSAIDTMARCLSLEKVQCPDPQSCDSSEQGAGASWDEVTQLWQDVYAIDQPGREYRTPCTHGRFVELTQNDVHSIDDHVIHDSSGRVSSEIFEALARKYEDLGQCENSTMEHLQATRVSDWLFGGTRTENGLQSWLMIPESLRDNGGKDDELSSIRSGSMESSGSCGSESTSATASESSSESGSMHEEDDGNIRENASISEDWIEDLLEKLLAKLKAPSEDASQRVETELVLETAWKMGQAILYRDMPRPSLREISEQSTGFYTAPASPAISSLNDGGSDGSLTMYTARSISPISWLHGDDIEMGGISRV